MPFSMRSTRRGSIKPFQRDKPLSELSTLRIGGQARFFTEITNIFGAQEVVRYCYDKKIPFHIVGKGSNSLFDDRGFDGLVILNRIQFLRFEGTNIQVGSGYSFSLLGVKTAKEGLKGLEFASGIPATVGGAIFMNAGANGREVADALMGVDFVTEKGELVFFSRDSLSFSYRSSCFQKRRGVIVGAHFHFQEDASAQDRQRAILKRRIEAQPYQDLSCGCVFRNPNGESAGALIDRCGLKGMKEGGAEVSLLHANFIVNRGGALAQDVLSLAKRIQKEVKKSSGVELEFELRLIPYRS